MSTLWKSSSLTRATYELPWNGTPFTPGTVLGWDTETEAIDEEDFARRPPRLALMQVSDGRRTVLLHPKQLGRFIASHFDGNHEWAAHNAKFDWWVVAAELERQM